MKHYKAIYSVAEYDSLLLGVTVNLPCENNFYMTLFRICVKNYNACMCMKKTDLTVPLSIEVSKVKVISGFFYIATNNYNITFHFKI